MLKVKTIQRLIPRNEHREIYIERGGERAEEERRNKEEEEEKERGREREEETDLTCGSPNRLVLGVMK